MTAQRAFTAGLSERLPAAGTPASMLFALSAVHGPATPRPGKLEQLRGPCGESAQYVLAISLSVTSLSRTLGLADGSSWSRPLAIPLLFLAGHRGATWGTVGHRAPSSFHWYDVVSGKTQRDTALLDDSLLVNSSSLHPASKRANLRICRVSVSGLPENGLL